MRVGFGAAGAAALGLLVHGCNGEMMKGFENGVNLKLDDPNAARTCLKVFGDGKSLNLVPGSQCGPSMSDAVWYFSTDGYFSTSKGFVKSYSDNAGAVQIYSEDFKPAKFSFLAGGKIRNEETKQCLAVGFFTSDVQFLKFADCSTAASWQLVGASIPYGSANVPTIIQQPVVQQQPVVVQQPAVVQQPVVQQVPTVVSPTLQGSLPQVPKVVPKQPAVVYQGNKGANGPSIAGVAARGAPSEGDHYLCICVISTSDDDCINAVKAACTIGHIPAEHCRASFEQNDHDAISTEIVRIIQKGAKCPSADMEKLKQEVAQAKIPTAGFHGQAVVTSEDHYLCVCLAGGNDSVRLDKQCEDAVRVACMVGHIPEPDCFASFDQQNHGLVVNHVMRMIDSGANCAIGLSNKKSSTCLDPPCYETSKSSAKKEPHSLCVCLEDRQSMPCKDAVKKACDAKQIPKTDCEVSLKADFHHAVTRHIMHLIDHGSQCNIGGGQNMLTFTNSRCHCKQVWTTKGGTLMSFPDNCGDPEGERGYAWCETYAEEGCIGVGDSMSWDRCDRPQRPRYHLGQFAQSSVGKVSPVDHYLCVCVDKVANDEACQVAAKAACMVGHIPSEFCAESFQQSQHARISDHILSLISHGARCNNIDIVSPISNSPVLDANGVPVMTIASSCGHGRAAGANVKGCTCDAGYAGLRCDYCTKGYTGYPLCVPKKDCSPACAYGECNFHTGECICPVSRKGPTCGECASGYTGSECAPNGLTRLTGGSWFGKLVFFAFIGGALYACCCTPFGSKFVSTLSRRSSDTYGGAYSKLNQEADFFEDELDAHENNALDVGGDADDFSGPMPSTELKPTTRMDPPQSHSGLAI